MSPSQAEETAKGRAEAERLRQDRALNYDAKVMAGFQCDVEDCSVDADLWVGIKADGTRVVRCRKHLGKLQVAPGQRV